MNKTRITLKPLLPSKLAVLTAAVATGALLAAASAATAAVVVRVSTNDALPGGTLTLQMRVDRAAGDSVIAGVQADLILSTDQLELVGKCSSDQSACENGTSCPNQGRCEPACVADPRLTQHSLAAAFPDFQNVPTGSRRLRLPLNPNDFPPPTLTDGLLVTCTFPVLAGAGLGPIQLAADSARFRVTDDASDPVVATLELHAGSVVSELVTPTPATATPTATPTETVAEITPTLTPTTEEATVTPTGGSPTTTPIVEATTTPTVEDMTPTLTPPPASATPTRTTSVPTSTPVEPTRTLTIAPTVTRTISIGTATPTSVPPTSTATVAGRHHDDDGCAMTPRGSGQSGAGAGFLVWAIGALMLGLRRDPK